MERGRGDVPHIGHTRPNVTAIVQIAIPRGWASPVDSPRNNESANGRPRIARLSH